MFVFAVILTATIAASAHKQSCISLKAVQEMQRYRTYTEQAMEFLNKCTGKYSRRSPITSLKRDFKSVDDNIAKLYRLHYKSLWLSEKAPNGHCYLFSKNTLQWKSAEERCQDIGGYLVKIDDSNENNWIVKQLPSRTSYWIGMSSSEPEVSFNWKHSYDNATVTYTNFRSGYPTINNSKCVSLHGYYYGQWANSSCNSSHYFICETNSC